MSRLRVGGLTRFSTVDYPGRLAAVVFCQGCPWRCRYCHNPHLLARRGAHELAWDAVLGFLARRRGLLDAAVFSGGEPTLQAALPGAIDEVRSLGFAIGLHTAGVDPRRLERILPLVDWIGIDVKAPPEAYRSVTGARASGERAWESVRLVVESGCAYEVRTTVDPALLAPSALAPLAADLARLGVRRYVVQQARGPDRRALQPAVDTSALYRDLGHLFPQFEVRAV